MEIRPATPADVPQVLPMVAQLCALHESWDPAKYGFLPHVAEGYRNWMTNKTADPRAVFLVADRPGRGPVAFLIGTVEREIPIYRLKEYGFVHDLWVEPDYRNEGLARTMVMTAIEAFRQIGVHQVRLDTAAPNDAARQLFAKCGFRPSTTEMLLELDAPPPPE
jgi:GNAT superfamily N-acetyltransferase